MPDSAMDRVLRLVAEGRLTAEEAGPILDALDMGEGTRSGDPPSRADGPVADTDRPAEGSARAIRVQVREAGRTVVNLRIPLSLGRVALTQVPGISQATSDRIREAIAGGIRGPIVDVDDGG
ncbi:MAG: hypothetical protein QOI00_336, partial [Chloroflexota bacterium]|nr:hypothetical protein [Chloroflexota bacterium]